MLVKIKPRKRASFKQLIDYMEQGTDERSLLLLHNLRGNRPEEWVREYQENESHRLDRRKGHVKLTHEILSFSPRNAADLDDEKLREITREYIRLRGERGLVVAMSHHAENVHVHLMVSGVEIRSGRSMRLSKTELTRVKLAAQKFTLERFPELRSSAVRHGKRAREVQTEKERSMKARTKKPSRNDALRDEVLRIFNASKDRGQFIAGLKAKGYEYYERGTKTRGITVDGRRFRFRTLGLENEQLDCLDRTDSRKHDLSRMREAHRANVRDHARDLSRLRDMAKEEQPEEGTSTNEL